MGGGLLLWGLLCAVGGQAAAAPQLDVNATRLPRSGTPVQVSWALQPCLCRPGLTLARLSAGPSTCLCRTRPGMGSSQPEPSPASLGASLRPKPTVGCPSSPCYGMMPGLPGLSSGSQHVQARPGAQGRHRAYGQAAQQPVQITSAGCTGDDADLQQTVLVDFCWAQEVLCTVHLGCAPAACPGHADRVLCTTVGQCRGRLQGSPWPPWPIPAGLTCAQGSQLGQRQQVQGACRRHAALGRCGPLRASAHAAEPAMSSWLSDLRRAAAWRHARPA